MKQILLLLGIFTLTTSTLFAQDDLLAKDGELNPMKEISLSEKGSFYLNVTALNGNSKAILDAHLQIMDINTQDIIAFGMPTSDERMQKVVRLNSERPYRVSIEAPGFESFNKEITFTKKMVAEEGCLYTLVADTLMTMRVELERPKKGEHLNFFHILFWNDSHVLLPKPREDLETVLDMMKENPKMKILIHGHTADKKKGPILSPAVDEKGEWKVFTFPSQRDKRQSPPKGSAQKLSELRAETVKRYLVQEGIDGSRIQTVGHGASKLLYPLNSPHAHKNKRVEIEIIEY